MSATTTAEDMTSAATPAPAPQAAVKPARPPEDASGAKDRDGWLEVMEAIGDEAGYFEPIGNRHWAFFMDEGPQLLVSFETLDEIRARPSQLPLGHDLAKAQGWSHLCLICEGETWYRDKRVYGYFDRLVDDAFFEDFDSVVFMGAGIQGYAAAAYCVAAPGAHVLLISPRATQLPDVAGWDRRNPQARRLDFRSRYGFAPDMVEGAGKVYVLHDPDIAEDAMHAALFRGKHVQHFRTPHLGGRLDWAFGHMQIWGALVEAVEAGSLTRTGFAKIWRARRSFGPYLRGMLARLGGTGHLKREKWLCNGVVSRLNAPTFRKRLNEILADEAAAEATAALAEVAEPAKQGG